MPNDSTIDVVIVQVAAKVDDHTNARFRIEERTERVPVRIVPWAIHQFVAAPRTLHQRHADLENVFIGSRLVPSTMSPKFSTRIHLSRFFRTLTVTLLPRSVIGVRVATTVRSSTLRSATKMNATVRVQCRPCSCGEPQQLAPPT